MKFLIFRKVKITRSSLKIIFFSLFLLVCITAGGAMAIKPVTIIDGGEGKKVNVLGFKVEDALYWSGIDYAPEDQIMPGLENPLKRGMEIIIERADEYSLEADGNIRVIRSVEKDPRLLLAEGGIFVGEQDRIRTGYDEKGRNLIKVIRITEEIVQEKVEIPFSTFRQPNNKLMRGEEELLRPGRKGWRVDEFKITKADGVEIERVEIKREIIEKPVRQIISYGIKRETEPVSRNLDRNVREIRTMEATAYTHTGNPTATGIYPYVGVVAVDPRVIPLGSKLYVEGYGYAEAQDTGGAIKGDRIDIFLDTKEECRNWGRRVVEVYFLE